MYAGFLRQREIAKADWYRVHKQIPPNLGEQPPPERVPLEIDTKTYTTTYAFDPYNPSDKSKNKEVWNDLSLWEGDGAGIEPVEFTKTLNSLRESKFITNNPKIRSSYNSRNAKNTKSLSKSLTKRETSNKKIYQKDSQNMPKTNKNKSEDKQKKKSASEANYIIDDAYKEESQRKILEKAEKLTGTIQFNIEYETGRLNRCFTPYENDIMSFDAFEAVRKELKNRSEHIASEMKRVDDEWNRPPAKNWFLLKDERFTVEHCRFMELNRRRAYKDMTKKGNTISVKNNKNVIRNKNEVKSMRSSYY
ncbi:hypothetical protein TRFO_05518 [Tritrichomonas foetus]|uniref:Uncharacterized protein n=1 Tax=Tritrichomonas foetus TaxID=1144522 RepID=A0A1J4K5S5_9EUKA|nr:hypothetical protein TRFO_05518 [Tritrichomonas foetus]|eukprot:OHT06346.1 hypothetical protein TRFO_05518 [Tritrichomonas foetus]